MIRHIWDNPSIKIQTKPKTGITQSRKMTTTDAALPFLIRL